MKRKALLILAAAILAVAMIPAIGVGAATGDVKIVTPDQLANPSGKTGSAFDKLEATNFVSDTTGTGIDLEDAGGTLYVVIEDNDSTANTLVPYHVYYGAIPLDTDRVRGGNLFYLDPNTALRDEIGVPISVTDGAGNFYGDRTTGDRDALAALVVGDANRNDSLDSDDIVIETGWYIAAVADNPATDADESEKAIFRSEREVRSSNAFADVNTDKNGIYLDIDEIPRLGTTTPADLNGAVATMRISIQSAGVDTLLFGATAGTNAGKSLVEVTSSSGDPIRITASEKDLGEYAKQAAGVNAAAFDGAISKDSGVFVARFGVIRNDFKDAITAYWDEVPAPADRTQTVTVIASGTPADGEVLAGSAAFDITLTAVGEADTYVEGTLKATYNPAGGTVVEGLTVLIVGTTATVTPPSASSADDTFTVTYTTESASGVIDAMLAIVDATGTDDQANTNIAEVFDVFCDSSITGGRDKECAEANSLRDAVMAHSANLDIDTTSAKVDEFLDNVIGAEHGDSVSVRYSDRNPRSVQTYSVEVDLVGPTIGGFSVADGAYIDSDDFEVLFDVTDADSGIFEDSHDIGKAAIRAELAYVSQEVLVGIGGDPDGSPRDPARLDSDEEITGGERYELTIDVSFEADEAEGDEDTDPVTVRVRATITAYDAARNVSTKTVNYVVDTIDPELEKTITGWGVKSRTNDGFVLVENQRDRIALVFDDAIQGDQVRPEHVSVSGGAIVMRVMWLNNAGNNKIDVGDTDEGGKSKTDLDFDDKTTTSGAAAEVVGDLGLEKNGPNQDARHILFLTLDQDLPTDATPTVEIDSNDLVDLAGNDNRSDHRSIAEDRLAPSFEVTIGQKLSNSDLAVTIVASEDLERRPRTSLNLGVDSIALSPSDNGNRNYTVTTTRTAVGLSGTGGQDGVWTVQVSGRDGNDNIGSGSVKWELDTQANDGKAPTKGGTDADGDVSVEVNEVIFLSLTFGDEADEYDDDADNNPRGKDSAPRIELTGVSMETLDADGNVTPPTVDLGTSVSQTSDGARHVIALSSVEQGSHQLKIEYADTPGNTGKFTLAFKVVAPQPVKVAVNPGWTLVSIPGVPQNTAIDQVLSGSGVTEVWSLDNVSKAWDFARMDEVAGVWEGTLQDMIDGRAYFVRSTTFDPISVLLRRFRPQNSPAMYTVTSGWNSIGYTPAGSEKSVEVDGYLGSLGISGWGMIRTWNTDASPPQYETYFSSGAATSGFPENADGAAVVEAGKGYLLFATRSGSIGG